MTCNCNFNCNNCCCGDMELLNFKVMNHEVYFFPLIQEKIRNIKSEPIPQEQLEFDF